MKWKSVPEEIMKPIMDSGLIWDFKGKLIDPQYIIQFETEGFSCFAMEKLEGS